MHLVGLLSSYYGGRSFFKEKAHNLSASREILCVLCNQTVNWRSSQEPATFNCPVAPLKVFWRWPIRIQRKNWLFWLRYLRYLWFSSVLRYFDANAGQYLKLGHVCPLTHSLLFIHSVQLILNFQQSRYIKYKHHICHHHHSYHHHHHQQQQTATVP